MNSNLVKDRLRAIGSDSYFNASAGDEMFEGWALPLLASWPKVLSVLDGGIPIPEVVELFPTNHCNFKCPHCRFREVHGARSEHMNLETLRALLKELKTRGVTRLEISGGGEPLDHPYALEMFKMINDMGFRVGLITNAYSMVRNSELIDCVVTCTDWIRISVDGFTDPTYRKVHGRADLEYASLRTTIKALIAKADDTPRIGLKMLLSKINVRDAVLAIPEGLKLGADYVQFKFLGFPEDLVLQKSDMHAVSDMILNQIHEHRNETMHVEFVPPFSGEKSYERCLMTYLHPVINWDGTIYLCAFFEHRTKEHSIGNIKEGGFFIHWDDAKHRAAFDDIDPLTCLPNCPMRRYNPLIAFMVRNDYRQGYV